MARPDGEVSTVEPCSSTYRAGSAVRLVASLNGCGSRVAVSPGFESGSLPPGRPLRPSSSATPSSRLRSARAPLYRRHRVPHRSARSADRQRAAGRHVLRRDRHHPGRLPARSRARASPAAGSGCEPVGGMAEGRGLAARPDDVPDTGGGPRCRRGDPRNGGTVRPHRVRAVRAARPGNQVCHSQGGQRAARRARRHVRTRIAAAVSSTGPALIGSEERRVHCSVDDKSHRPMLSPRTRVGQACGMATNHAAS